MSEGESGVLTSGLIIDPKLKNSLEFTARE